MRHSFRLAALVAALLTLTTLALACAAPAEREAGATQAPIASPEPPSPPAEPVAVAPTPPPPPAESGRPAAQAEPAGPPPAHATTTTSPPPAEPTTAPPRPSEAVGPPTPTAPDGPYPIIAIDPGHGGDETGAVSVDAAGRVLVERDVNLAIAVHLADMLREDGYGVVLTREDAGRANAPDSGLQGRALLTADLNARLEKVNRAGADLFLSIHNNGSPSAGESGSEVWYCPEREFADRNLTLARLLQTAFLDRLLEVGYRSRDRGVKEDTNFRIYQGRPYCLFVLGPPREPRKPQATEMPGVLGESLFVSNPTEAGLLRRDDVLLAIARAYHDAVRGYFEVFPAP